MHVLGPRAARSLSCHGMGRSFSQFTGIGLGFSKACVPSAGIVTAAFP